MTAVWRCETGEVETAVDWDDELTLGAPGGGMLALGHPEFVMDRSKLVRIPVRVTAPGLIVESVIELVPWSEGAWIQGLIGYLDDLDRSWRGWTGIKEWSDAERQVTLSPAPHSTLFATMTVSVRRFPDLSHGIGGWNASAVVAFESAAMARLAKRMRVELAGAPRDLPSFPERG